MDWLKALLLGIVQGLTEFLPVSSSGHIELGQALLGFEAENDLAFSLLVHLATVLSTIIVFRKDILGILKDILKFEWNVSTRFAAYIIISMIPAVVIGFTLKDQLEALFKGKVAFVGIMLLVTGLLLLSTVWIKPKGGRLTPLKAFIIGIAQAVALLPGISRSGATIATALNLGVSREQAARFSFLMVLLPIIGASIIELKDVSGSTTTINSTTPLVLGFIGAFISGLLACTWMIKLVKKGKIQYFAYYCFAIGIIAIVSTLL